MKKITVAILLFFVLSCTNSGNYESITGEWECISWINKERNTDKCNNNVYFKFNEDKSYLSKIGSVKDSGIYSIENNRLYVTPNGKMELSVQINKLNFDTVVFLMNLGGVEELLTLVKKKR